MTANRPPLGHQVVSDHGDVMYLLQRAGGLRQSRLAVMSGVLKAAGHKGRALIDLTRLNLLTEDGPPHRTMRRFALNLLTEIAAHWPPERVAAEVRGLLAPGLAGGEIDLHRALSLELAVRVVGDGLGMDPAAVAELRDRTVPIFEAGFRATLRMAEYQALADLAEGLTRVLAHLAAHPETARALRADPSGQGAYLRERLRQDAPQAWTKPMRAPEDILLPSGRVLSRGTAFICDVEGANRDPGGMEQPDLSFGTGAHRCPAAGLSLVVLKEALAVVVADYALEPLAPAEVLATPVGRRHLSAPMRIRAL